MSGPLLLDTSAVFVDLFGSFDHRRELHRMRAAHALSGISPYVRREAEFVLRSGYTTILNVLGDVPKGRRMLLKDIWSQVRDRIKRDRAPGVELVAGQVVSCHESMYDGNDIVDVTEVRNDLRGQLRSAILRLGGSGLEVLHQTAFDRSACRLWAANAPNECERGPCGGCALLIAAGDERFLALVAIVAEDAAFKETKEQEVLRRLLPQYRVSDSLGRMQLIIDNPNGFGDLLVLWELPDGATLLTTDRIFPPLVELSHRQVRPLIARRIRDRAPDGTTAHVSYLLPRTHHRRELSVRVEDYNSGGLCVWTNESFDRSKSLDVDCPALFEGTRRAVTVKRIDGHFNAFRRVHLKFINRRSLSALDG